MEKYHQTESRVNKVLRKLVPSVEKHFERLFPKSIVRFLTEFLVFGVKQAWACLFGGLLLIGILLSESCFIDEIMVPRYDLLLAYAIFLQVIFLVLRLERLQEAVVILIFHCVGTAMELFKTAAGSWTYPEESFMRFTAYGGDVPLFSGFMYAAVGSYLARVIRIHEFKFTYYPNRFWTVLLAFLIYVNFFTHHYFIDLRLVLFGFAAILFFKSSVCFSVWRWQHQMPLLLGFFLVALFLWVAENIGTYAGAWLYPEQSVEWSLVSFSKMGSWYLLMIVSWVLVTFVHKPVTIKE